MSNHYTFRGTTVELTNLLKWCRSNLGNRGLDWDFTGGVKKVELVIKNPKYLTFFVLKYPKSDISLHKR
jgi:hypothetical protein